MALYILLPLEPVFSSPISAFLKVIVMMLGEFQFEEYIPIEKVLRCHRVGSNKVTKNGDYFSHFFMIFFALQIWSDMERKSNISVNWTLQIIFLGFAVLVAMVMGYLTVGLTVHKMDEVLSKAELHLTHKRVRDILMVDGPDGEAVVEYLKKKRLGGGKDEQDTDRFF